MRNFDHSGTLSLVPVDLWNGHVIYKFEYMKVIYVYCGFMKCMKAILAVINTTYLVK